MPTATLVSIVLSKILPNPQQPRRRFRRGSIQEMADSLIDLGQQTPAKVRPLTPDEKALNPGFDYMLIGGHRRLAGAKLAGWRALDCIILDIPPGDTHMAALVDNDAEEMDWWDWDLAIEVEAKAQAVPSQRQLATRLGIGLTKVNIALKITKALSANARELVTQNLDKAASEGGEGVRTPNTGGAYYQITEYVLLALANLEDQLLIYRALKVVLDQHLTEQKTKKLVDWVKQGGQPDDFDRKEEGNRPEDPYETQWALLRPGIKVKYKGRETYQVQMTIQGEQETWNVASAAANALKGQGSPTTDPVLSPSQDPAPPSHPSTEALAQVDGAGGLFPLSPEAVAKGEAGGVEAVPDLAVPPQKGFLGVLISWRTNFGRAWAKKNIPELVKAAAKSAWQNGSLAVRNPAQTAKELFNGQDKTAALVSYWAIGLGLVWVVFKVLSLVWHILRSWF